MTEPETRTQERPYVPSYELDELEPETPISTPNIDFTGPDFMCPVKSRGRPRIHPVRTEPKKAVGRPRIRTVEEQKEYRREYLRKYKKEHKQPK